MSQPPRGIERIIESLGVDKDVCDAVVGDFAEEFASRVQHDGERTARRWYYRETARSIPLLLRRWLRDAHVRDFTRLIGIAMSSYVCMLVLAGMVAATVYSFASAFHVSLRRGIDPSSPAIVLIGLGLGTATLGGYIAAWFDRRAPVVAGLGFGITYAILHVIGRMLDNGAFWKHTPFWYRPLVPALFILCAFAGGIVRAATQRDDPELAEG